MEKKFWNWTTRKNLNQETEELVEERILTLNGVIAEDSWFDDDVTPKLFKDELESGTGDITVWINSVGGDCICAAQIYNMLTNYKGNVTVKIDGIAASAASVIAMAGNKVYMSPVSMMMIHNPSTGAFGDHNEMQKAIEMLEGVKNSIINAYVVKTGLSRAKLSRLMEDETWMDATKAVELGFCDEILSRTEFPKDDESTEVIKDSVLFSYKAVNNALLNKLEAHFKKPVKSANEQAKIPAPVVKGRPAKELMDRLEVIKKFI